MCAAEQAEVAREDGYWRMADVPQLIDDETLRSSFRKYRLRED